MWRYKGTPYTNAQFERISYGKLFDIDGCVYEIRNST
jgi:hypothetical protein